MNFSRRALLCLLLSASQPWAAAQVRSPRAQASSGAHHVDPETARYSTEAYVIEEYQTEFRFEKDGTGQRALTARMRIQNDAAAGQLGELAFPFNASNEEMDVRFARVRRADGTLADAGTEAVTEEPASAVRNAPAYSNFKEKHIRVPPLQRGDLLEYEIVTRFTRPVAAGEFFAEHAFLKDAIVLDETVEISVPQGRAVTVRSPGFPYSTDSTSVAGHTIYRWKHANLAVSPEDKDSPPASRENQTASPDIALSSFAAWGDVSRWYAKLDRGSAEPGAEVRKKTAVIIAGKATELEKIEALYDYVARNIRYVDLPFGAAGYAPRTPAEVLRDQYGDAKDKDALLAAMLGAAGIQADTALVPQSPKLESYPASPSQVKSALTVATSGGKLIWMDPGPEVAPFQFLPPALRHKPALLAGPDRAGRIAETPVDPPFLSTQRVEVQGRVSELGKLTAGIHYRIRGDNEFVLRLAFHRTPAAQWKDLGQTLLTLDGLHGEVTLATSSDPLDTREPFQVDLEYAQSDFLSWSSKKAQVALPLLAIGMPDAPKNSQQPITLGSPLDVNTRLTLALPPGFTAVAPVGINVTRDYAEFQSSYRYQEQDRTLTAERSLKFKTRSLAASSRGDYLAFNHAVDADQAQPLSVASSNPGVPDVPPDAAPGDLLEAGAAALAAGNAASAIPLFERAVALEPAQPDAWNELGLAHLRLAQLDQAAAAFEKQLQMNPGDPHANNYLGITFEKQGKYDEAAAAFRKQIAIDPLDTIAHGALGTILLAQRQYLEAAPELDKATVLSPRKAELQVSLGQAYLNLGQNEKAIEAFDRAVRLSPTPAIWNNAAFNLADHKVELAKAQKYAESAVSAAAADLAKIDLPRLTAEQLAQVSSMGNYWDTLGWIYYQKGDLDFAERYIRAAWLLDQRGEIADHLARISEKRGKKEDASRIYALALAAPHPDPDTRARLTLLLGGNSRIDELTQQAAPALAALRAIPAGKLLDENAQAEFAILLSAGKTSTHSSRVESIRFLSGSEKLRVPAERLRSLDFGPLFPEASPARLVRRGTLLCAAGVGCTFMVHLPDDPSGTMF